MTSKNFKGSDAGASCPAVGGRPPQHDLDAESAVLSAMMLDSYALDAAIGIVDAEHFYSDANKAIFRACVELNGRGEQPDIVSIGGHLRGKGQLAAIGGSAYLAQISDATPATANVEAHARIVRNLGDLRRFQHIADMARSEAYFDVGDVRAFMQDKLVALSEVAVGEDASRGENIGDIMESSFRKWAEPEKYDTAIKVSTGVPSLDRIMRTMRGGNLIVIGAHSGIGKTTLARTIAVNVARQKARSCAVCKLDVAYSGNECPSHKGGGIKTQRQGVLFFTIEEDREEVTEAIAFSVAMVDNSKIEPERRESITPDEWARIAEAAKSLSRVPLKIVDDARDMQTVTSIAIGHKRALEKNGDRLALIVIDYAQLMKTAPSTPKGETTEQRVANVAHAAKELASKLKCVVVMPAQLNKEGQKEGRKPRPSDLRDSQVLFHDANKVLLIHNPEQEKRLHSYTDGSDGRGSIEDVMDCAEVIVAKNRKGRTGIVRIAFMPAYGRFSEWPEGREMPSNDNDASDARQAMGGKRRRA